MFIEPFVFFLSGIAVCLLIWHPFKCDVYSYLTFKRHNFYEVTVKCQTPLYLIFKHQICAYVKINVQLVVIWHLIMRLICGGTSGSRLGGVFIDSIPNTEKIYMKIKHFCVINFVAIWHLTVKFVHIWHSIKFISI